MPIRLHLFSDRHTFYLFRFWVLLCSLGLFSTSCKKNISPSVLVTESYIHAYPQNGDQFGWYVKATPEHGCMLIGTDEKMGNLIVLKIDERGQLIQRDTIKGVEMIAPIFTNLQSGEILVSSGYSNGNLCKLDQDGNLLFKSYFYGTEESNSYPVVMKNGYYAIASSFGWGPGNYSAISFLKPDGTYFDEIQIQDVSFGPKYKTLYTSLHRCDTMGTYYFNGWCFPNWKFTFRDRAKFFVAKQQYSGNTLVSNRAYIVDSTNTNYSVGASYQVNTTDEHTLLAASFLNADQLYTGKIIKLDADLNSIWERDLLIGYSTVCNGITECPDGNYLVFGVCFSGDKSVNQPFACKLDKNGQVIWQNIFSTKLYGQFSWGEQAADGTCFFVGHTSGFSQGSSLSDIFLLKTDSKGNLK